MAGPRLISPSHKVGREWLVRTAKDQGADSLEQARRAAQQVPGPEKSPSMLSTALNLFQHHLARARAYQGLELPDATQNELVGALLTSASAALTQQGVKHTAVGRTLVISPEGTHPLNLQAAKISRQWHGTVRYAPEDLVGRGWAATFSPASNSLGIDHAQILQPDVLTNGFKHEQIHMESDFAIRAGRPWATSGYLLGIDEGVLPQAVAGLDHYRAFQSIDELPAYLVSLEHCTEHALAASTPAELRKAVDALRYDTVNLLDVALRTEGVLRRSVSRVQKGDFDLFKDPSGRVAVEVRDTTHSDRAHEVFLPQPGEAQPAESALDARLAAATTHLAMARLSQSVVDALPADTASAKVMLAALGDLFREVIADRDAGKRRLTFPEAVARFNASVEAAQSKTRRGVTDL
ncbi:MAG: hypothetical protein JNK82_42355 [Myxococcaceae bacterium]|nr:hypothetical protein [Myxococcaceae bacterium]